jgi:hypothetical protein
VGKYTCIQKRVGLVLLRATVAISFSAMSVLSSPIATLNFVDGQRIIIMQATVLPSWLWNSEKNNHKNDV